MSYDAQRHSLYDASPASSALTRVRSASRRVAAASTFVHHGARAHLGATLGVVAGVLDGAVTVLRIPSAERSFVDALWIIAYSSALLAPVGAIAAALQSILERAAQRRSLYRTMRAWISAGPSRWFAASPTAARRVLLGAIAVAVASFAGFVASLTVLRSVRTPTLAALSLVALAPVALLVGTAVALLVAAPIDMLQRRVRGLASVGGALTASLVTVLASGVVVALWQHAALARLNPTTPLAFICAAFAYLACSRRAAPPTRGAMSIVLVLTVAAFVYAAITLGRSQRVLSTIAQRGVMARMVIPPLQQLSDRDRDGYGRWFGGGDCNDDDAHVNPLAPEIPGNGRDENCTGIDAPLTVLDDPFEVAVSTPAALRPSVVFLSIDAVRADHVGAYGYARETTPRLDAFASRAARFERAYTTAPQTTRAFASVFTGRPPHGLCWGRDPQFPPLRDPNEMLAEVLRSEGYATAAFTNTSYFALTAGFSQGFDVFEQGGGFKDDAELSAARANDWVERVARTPRPFFLWLHLVDPHEPYTDRTTPKDFGHEAIDRYDEEIANADRALTRILPTLDAIERAGRPLLVFAFSDHGEAFGEHGVLFHSYDVHEEALRVPLMVRGPGVVPGPRRQLTSLMDLFPTVLSFVQRTPSLRSPARSLTQVLANPEAPPWRTALFADVAPNGDQRVSAMALVAPPWKLLHDATRGAWELVHLERDPGEHENVIDREPAVAERLRARLSDMARPMTGHCPKR